MISARRSTCSLILFVLCAHATACGPEPIVGPPGSQDDDMMPAPTPDMTPIRPGGGNQIPWPDMNRLDQGNQTDQANGLDMARDLPADLDTSDMSEIREDMPGEDMPATTTNPPECAPLPVEDRVATSLSDVTSSYSPSMWESALLTMMSRRYPQGYNLLQAGRSLGTSGDCITQYEDFMDTSSLGRFALDLGITLRSCAYVFHTYDATRGSQDLIRYNPTTGGVDIKSFTIPTSWPKRGAVKPYLGAEFAQDDSVFNHLTRQEDLDAPMSAILDEMQIYLEELISGYVLRDVLTTELSVSRREPVLMHQLWTLIYLYHLRNTAPAAYMQLIQDDALRTHILWIWSRAEYVIEASSAVGSLGVGRESAIIAAMSDSRWDKEIDALRAIHGCR